MIRSASRGTTGGGRTLIGVLLALVLVLAACGGGGDDDNNAGAGAEAESDPPRDEGEPVQGGSITVGLESETNSWLPGTWAGAEAGYNVGYAIYDPLVAKDGEGNLSPYLAESVEPNEDASQWTVTLREGVEFHDGTPLDADALKHNFDNVLKVETANTYANLADVEMEVVDELTVRYVLAGPNAGFPDLLLSPIGWPFSPTAWEELGEDLGDQPVGTGPFQFVSWRRDDTFVAERNANYWQEGRPYLDRITFQPIPDEESRGASLESGSIDATHSVRLSSFLASVQAMDGVRVSMGASNAGSGSIINTSVPPVDDVRVRRALAYAIDQEALIEVVAGDAAELSEVRTQYFSENSPYHSDAVADAWPTNDPEQAQELHDDYVNDPNRSDGKAPGEPIEIDFSCTNVPALQQQAELYQAMWGAIGFDVNVQAVEQSVHIQNALEDNFMVNCWRMGSDEDPYIILNNAFGDPEVQIQNFTNYHDDEIAGLLDTIRTEVDADTRADAIEQIGMKLAEDVPVLWTGGNNEFVGAREAVRGIENWTLPDGSTGSGARRGIARWGGVWINEG